MSVRIPSTVDPEAFQSLSTRKRKNVTEQNTAVAVAHHGSSWRLDGPWGPWGPWGKVDLEKTVVVFVPKEMMWKYVCEYVVKCSHCWICDVWIFGRMLSKSGYVGNSGPKYVSRWWNCCVCVCRKPFEHTPICNLCNIQSVLILTSLQSWSNMIQLHKQSRRTFQINPLLLVLVASRMHVAGCFPKTARHPSLASLQGEGLSVWSSLLPGWETAKWSTRDTESVGHSWSKFLI